MKTLTGMTREQVTEKMQEYLGEDAYKEVGGASYLTDINPAYTRQVLTECFGLCGEGWWYDYDSMNVSLMDRPTATIEKFYLYYAYTQNGETLASRPVISAAGNSNRNVEDAMKGAVTSALQKAASMLLFQLDVYKGKVSHKKAPPRKKQNVPQRHDTKKRPASSADIKARADHYGNIEASDKQRGLVVGVLEECFGGMGNEKEKRASVTAYLFGVESSKDLTGGQVKAILDWLKPERGSDGMYRACEEACSEARKIVVARMKDMGQQSFEEE